MVQPVFPWGVNAAVIAQNSANFQQKLADEPCAVTLYCYPLKAYPSSMPGSPLLSEPGDYLDTW